MTSSVVRKIVSGGQTGVDRAALDVALELGLETGGWIPLGRRAEDGRVPGRYDALRECDSASYETRTERNVRDSDATLILAPGTPRGGTALTARIAGRLGRPLLVVDCAATHPGEAAVRVRAWLAATGVQVLNVAGPRASQEPGASASASEVLRLALAEVVGPP